MKIIILREREGVYQFGKKRVGVKIEQDGIKIVDCGDCVPIIEFLNPFTTVENDKLESIDNFKRFSERAATQNQICESAESN